MSRIWSVALVGLVALSATVTAADLTSSLKEGTVSLKSIGPLSFGPDGVLFVSDPSAAKVYAIDTEDRTGSPDSVSYNIQDVSAKIASLLGASPANVQVADLAVNPASGNVYLSVTRTSGGSQTPVLLRAEPSGDMAEVVLKNVKQASATLPNPPADRTFERRGRRQNNRTMSVTDLAYVDGRVFIAGLSNEEFASNLRSIPFPFEQANAGTSVEIYHGAHGRFETNSPIRTFAAFDVAGEPNLLAAYTCTPLVRFPLSQLKPGSKYRGTTIAELGNRNRPLDMFVYDQGGKNYVLMANSARGVMKITTEGIDKQEGITSRVGGGGTAGLKYDTVESLKGVTQLDRLNSANAIALASTEDGKQSLTSFKLP